MQKARLSVVFASVALFLTTAVGSVIALQKEARADPGPPCCYTDGTPGGCYDGKDGIEGYWALYIGDDDAAEEWKCIAYGPRVHDFDPAHPNQTPQIYSCKVPIGGCTNHP